MDTVAEGEEEVCGGAVHGVARADHLGALAQHVCGLALGARQQLEQGHDGADGDPRVEVRGAVDGVAADGVVAGVVLEDDQLLLLLRDEDLRGVRRAHRVDEDLVPQHVQLLLLVPGRVRRPEQPAQLDQLRTPDRVRDELERKLQRVHHQRELPRRVLRQLLVLDQKPGQRHHVRVDLLLRGLRLDLDLGCFLHLACPCSGCLCDSIHLLLRP